MFLQARTLVQAAPPDDELSGLPLALLAKTAAHWKAKIDRHHHSSKLVAMDQEQPTVLSPMEELMGRGVVALCHDFIVVPKKGTETIRQQERKTQSLAAYT